MSWGVALLFMVKTLKQVWNRNDGMVEAPYLYKKPWARTTILES
ncbi:hypothetical protein [Bacillus sp. ISL-4]|nr:hypothetical protein [Bacillus sp. ISL-4]